MSTLNFDANSVEPQASFDPLPTDWYNVTIVASELKPTNDGQGAYLSLQFKVLDGPFVNRVVFTNLNIQNKNPVTVEIAYKQLSAICHAVNVLHCAESEQLHDKPLQIRAKYKEPQGNYDAGNDIKGFKAIDGPAASAGGAATGAATNATPTPDWAAGAAGAAGAAAPATAAAEPAAVAEPVQKKEEPAPATTAAAEPTTAEPAAAAVATGATGAPPWATPAQ